MIEPAAHVEGAHLSISTGHKSLIHAFIEYVSGDRSREGVFDAALDGLFEERL
jgi:hypothetical protein